MFGGIVVLSAQDTQDTTSNQYRTESQSQYPQDLGQQQDRERIQATELPDEVKRALEGEEYRGWLISGAFKSQASAEQSMGADTTGTDPNQGTANARVEEGEEFFTVELKNGAETRTVHFKSDGQILEGMDDSQNSPANPYTPGDPNQNEMNRNGRMNQYPNDPSNRDNPNDQYNQNNQNNQNGQDNRYNQNDPLNQQDPGNQTTPDQSLPGDPNTPDQSGQSQSTDPSQTDPSTGTPTPGTQPDQSRTNGPK